MAGDTMKLQNPRNDSFQVSITILKCIFCYQSMQLVALPPWDSMCFFVNKNYVMTKMKLINISMRTRMRITEHWTARARTRTRNYACAYRHRKKWPSLKIECRYAKVWWSELAGPSELAEHFHWSAPALVWLHRERTLPPLSVVWLHLGMIEHGLSEVAWGVVGLEKGD